METKTNDARADKKLYKVLKEGVSYNGGNYKYDLPKQNEDGSWKPGKWTKRIAKAKVSMCNNGYHLTTTPKDWFQTGAKIFLAEAKDIMGWEGDKCVCAQVRLLEQIDTNTGQDNTGEFNSGDNNSGDSNSG